MDIRVRRGKDRPCRVDAALDCLPERLRAPTAPPTRLRVVVEANLPRGQGARPGWSTSGSQAGCSTAGQHTIAHAHRQVRNLMLWPESSLPLP
jgi:hypothetical protein